MGESVMETSRTGDSIRHELEIRASLERIWQALTDMYEQRAWWGFPIVNFEPEVGGGYEIVWGSQGRTDKVVFTVWNDEWQLGGTWSTTVVPGEAEELITLVPIGETTRVTIEVGNLDSFGPSRNDARSYHQQTAAERLGRLRKWCEHRIPARELQPSV